MTATINQQQRLSGDALLTHLQENEGMSKADLVKLAGFTSINDDGSERIEYTEFYKSLMEARGIHFPTDEEILAQYEERKQKQAERRASGEKETYMVQIPVTTMMTVYVDDVAGLSKEEVCELVTREHIANAEGEMSWDDMKDAWRGEDYEYWYVADEEGEEV